MNAPVPRRGPVCRRPQNPSSNPIIRELIDARVSQGLSVAALAKKCGYAETLFWKWESGKVFPRLQSLTDWGSALGYEVKLTPIHAGENPAL